MTEEDKQSAALPTLACNRFRVEASKVSCRIVLGHEVMKGISGTYHHAVYMTPSDARWLADLINKQLDTAEGLP